MNATITFSGVSGHSARPWPAENAIEQGDRRPGSDRGARAPRGDRRRAAVLRGRVDHADRGGIADNVIPDRAVATLNFRYAPDRTPESAAAYLLLAHAGRRGARDHRRLAAGDRRHRHAARARAPRRRRSHVRAEAGVDERRRLHDARDRRGQLRPGRNPLRPSARRARRDRRARAALRDARSLPRRS